MRGATVGVLEGYAYRLISIHAPHAGSDTAALGPIIAAQISIHAPHAGSDHGRHGRVKFRSGFQSTLPMRGATLPLGSPCSL